MKYSLAQSEIVTIRRRWPPHLLVHMAGMVHEAAKAGMGLQPAAARQIDGMCRDVVDRGAAVVERQRDFLARLQRQNGCFRGDRLRRIAAPALEFAIKR